MSLFDDDGFDDNLPSCACGAFLSTNREIEHRMCFDCIDDLDERMERDFETEKAISTHNSLWDLDDDFDDI